MKNHANKIQFFKIERCRFLDDYYAQFESRTEKAKAAQEIQVADIIDFTTRITPEFLCLFAIKTPITFCSHSHKTNFLTNFTNGLKISVFWRQKITVKKR